MATPTTTLAAVHTQWNADAGITAAGLTLWNGQPPEGTTLGTYFSLEDMKETERRDAMGGFKWLESRWSFAGYFEGDAVAEAAALTVRAAFEDKALPAVTGRNFFQMMQTGYLPQLDETRSTSVRRVLVVRLDLLAEWSIPGSG